MLPIDPVRRRDGLTEPSAGLLGFTQPSVGHRQKYPIDRCAFFGFMSFRGGVKLGYGIPVLPDAIQGSATCILKDVVVGVLF